jgi:hypothetical protein
MVSPSWISNAMEDKARKRARGATDVRGKRLTWDAGNRYECGFTGGWLTEKQSRKAKGAGMDKIGRISIA